MFFREQKTRLPWKKDWEKQSTHKRLHMLYPQLPAHCLWARGGAGLARCEEEGFFPRALYSCSNHPICCNHSLL